MTYWQYLALGYRCESYTVHYPERSGHVYINIDHDNRFMSIVAYSA